MSDDRVSEDHTDTDEIVDESGAIRTKEGRRIGHKVHHAGRTLYRWVATSDGACPLWQTQEHRSTRLPDGSRLGGWIPRGRPVASIWMERLADGSASWVDVWELATNGQRLPTDVRATLDIAPGGTGAAPASAGPLHGGAEASMEEDHSARAASDAGDVPWWQHLCDTYSEAETDRMVAELREDRERRTMAAAEGAGEAAAGPLPDAPADETAPDAAAAAAAEEEERAAAPSASAARRIILPEAEVGSLLARSVVQAWREVGVFPSRPHSELDDDIRGFFEDAPAERARPERWVRRRVGEGLVWQPQVRRWTDAGPPIDDTAMAAVVAAAAAAGQVPRWMPAQATPRAQPRPA